ncbi:amphi-Trp domain-containing protein [Streptomyces sp. NBC_01077]|uniref:amphi-Trp domain-containing protein n=1 Tax=Streptomyces sp. NBC_01077 TaxID=2903746 RepID=UPI00386E19A7|nr:amphi-Trp domain-containing protein [Streptomyces sp. NBC_01077]
MKDLKFEQKRSMSRLEAADQLAALAAALRQGGDVELEFGLGTLSLHIPDDLRSEVEVEVGSGEVELEIEFKWPTAPARRAPKAAADAAKPARRRKSAPAKPTRSSTGAGAKKGTSAKPSAAKKS